MKSLLINEISINNPSEDGFASFFGIGGGCWPLCERKWREQNAQQAISSVGDLPAGASCTEIDAQINRVQNEINAVNGKIAAGDKAKRWKNALMGLEDKMKAAQNAKAVKKCQELLEQQQKEAEIQQNKLILEETAKSATSVDEAQVLKEKLEAAKGKKTDYTKIIAIGIGGLLAVAAVIILIKPKN